MVATKRVPLAEVYNGKDRKPGTHEVDLAFQGPLGGFIFVCNNDTIGEDFERHLFGLPERYHDSVKFIHPGLPLFLYNYSTRCLHGVFEASSDGGLNIEPEAWGENKVSRKNGKQSSSRFPAQVRVRWREERPPLEEERFRPVLYHYDGPKFRLQLSKSEVHDLLELFGASPSRKIEEPQEDTDGEWEKVKTKSKVTRTFRATLSKGSVSPNASSGRRRGPSVNGHSSNGVAFFSSFNSSVQDVVSRVREVEMKSDSPQRWRTDSDSWSGSSSGGTASSNCGSHDEDQSRKVTRDNGCNDEISEGASLVGPCGDNINGIAFSENFGGSNHSDHKSEIMIVDDSNDMNGVSNSMTGASVASNSNNRSGFVSYSAALKSGILGASAAENGLTENHVSSPKESVTPPLSSLGNRSSVNSYSSVASASIVPPSGILKGDLSRDRIDGSKQKTDLGWIKSCSRNEIISSNHGRVGPVLSVANGKEEPKADQTSREGDDKGIERMHPWGKPLTVRSNPPEVGSGQSTSTFGDSQKSLAKPSIDSSSLSNKPAKNAPRSNNTSEVENGVCSIEHQCQALPEVKENSVKPEERENVWQSNDGAVVRLLHDLDPAVNSTSVTGGITEQRVESELLKKGQRPSFQPSEDNKPEILQSLPGDVHQIHCVKQLSSPSGGLLSHGSHPKVSSQEPEPQLVFQQNKSFHEPRRQQFDGQKYEKHQEDRPHFRKQQAHPQDHSQHTSSILHTQQHQGGQGMMPLRVPTPPSPSMQHHHQPLLSPAPLAAVYRSRNRPANGSVENVHGLAYRPITRNLLDGEVAMQSQLRPGSWGLQSPVLLTQPVLSPVIGNLTFPTPLPHLLTNAEILHREILEFAQVASPSEEVRKHAEAAVDCVRKSVKRLWENADVEVFGSFATGLCLRHSDVDVVVVDAPLPHDTLENPALSGARLLTPMIRDLATALKNDEWCEGLNTIETASMPVIKLCCRPSTDERSAGLSVAIDITIGGKRSSTFAGVSQGNVQREAAGSKPLNPKFEAARNAHNGAAAREFVIERLRQLPALAPLVLLLKSFLRYRNLNDVYSGGLGSFALTLMLVFYLERVPISCGVTQEAPQMFKSPSTKAETSTVSVDTTQASTATAESVDFSDDDSSDSSVLTTTSASSMVSAELASLQGNSCVGDNLQSPPSCSNEESVLRKAGCIVDELLSSMHSVRSPNLGMLLVGFLHFFGQEIDFSRVRLVLKGKNGSPGGVFWHEKNARTLPLCIDDPLRPDAYIGAGSFNIWQVQAALRDMLSVITRPLPVPSVTVPDGRRAGNGPDGSEHFRLLHQLLVSDVAL